MSRPFSSPAEKISGQPQPQSPRGLGLVKEWAGPAFFVLGILATLTAGAGWVVSRFVEDDLAAVERSVNEKIEEVEDSVNERIDGIQDDLDRRLDELTASLARIEGALEARGLLPAPAAAAENGED